MKLSARNVLPGTVVGIGSMCRRPIHGPEGLIAVVERLTRILPIAVNPGNVGVSFDVLSYAGRLTVTVVADPVVVPEVDRVTELLGAHLAGLTA